MPTRVSTFGLTPDVRDHIRHLRSSSTRREDHGSKEGREEGQKGRQEDQDHEEGRKDREEAGEAQGRKKTSQAGSRQEAREKGGASVCGKGPLGGIEDCAEGRSRRPACRPCWAVLRPRATAPTTEKNDIGVFACASSLRVRETRISLAALLAAGFKGAGASFAGRPFPFLWPNSGWLGKIPLAQRPLARDSPFRGSKESPAGRGPGGHWTQGDVVRGVRRG